MADESDYARAYARDVRVDPAINGQSTVQDALAASAGAAWIPVGIPTADPHVVGQIWANSHVLTVSAG
jgi:hypothetical protein